MKLFLNALGDEVEWDDLTSHEQAYHSNPRPWLVTEYGFFVNEYVRHMEHEEYLEALHGGDPRGGD